MRMIRGIATVSAGSLTALGLALGIGACGVASASVRPAASHLPVVISATGHANRAIGTYRAGRVIFTNGGPDLSAWGLHWTQWNSTSASAYGTVVAGDSSVWTFKSTLRFSHVETGGNGVRYFENVHISTGNANGVNSNWHWVWSQGDYAG
jgi:hypothetical protein